MAGGIDLAGELGLGEVPVLGFSSVSLGVGRGGFLLSLLTTLYATAISVFPLVSDLGVGKGGRTLLFHLVSSEWWADITTAYGRPLQINLFFRHHTFILSEGLALVIVIYQLV